MARQRNYKAEYAARSRRAKTAGFDSYNDQRQLRRKAAVLIPGRSTAAVAQRDVFALEMSEGRARAQAGVPEAWSDLLVNPRWGEMDIAELRGQLTADEWAILSGLMQTAFDESGGGKLPGMINVDTLADINTFMIEHGITLREWWAELYGRAA